MILIAMFATSSLTGQVTVLSESSVTQTWRDAQLKVIEQQLESINETTALAKELESQRRWLSAWQPGALSDEPLLEPERQPPELLKEPTLDPNAKAAALRRRLFGPQAKPTAADTRQLQRLLPANPEDIGLRQLHLHWLDQPQYRKQYCVEIAEAARELEKLLRAEDESKEQKLALGFTLYRGVRALAYRELPEAQKLRPIENREKYEAELLSTYSRFKQDVPARRPEFVLIDVRMLRRDQLHGQALVLLETYGESIDRKWLLKKRRDILRDLGWDAAASEAAELYAEQYPNEVAKEAEQTVR